MKIYQKLSILAGAATASVLSFSSGAFAGEGGAAGAAAFTIDTTSNNVTGVAVAASVGKNDASAAAFNDVGNNFNSAFALGSAAEITITDMKTDDAAMEGAPDTALATAQGNDLTGSATIQLGTGDGDVITTIPGEAAP